MCFTSQFFLKKYNLVIGPDRRTTDVIRYVFDGWADEKQRERFYGSVAFLEAEAIAGRTDPSLRGSGVYMINGTAPELEGIGTQVGSILEVSYGTQYCNAELFDDFFKKSGVAVHRAEPFHKPIVSLGQLLKEKLFGRR